MTTFVHLTPESNVRAIRRAGLRTAPTRVELPPGVYALPTGPEFAVSHQWLRELKWRGERAVWAVYFRLPDTEPVWMGHYGGPHRRLSAGEAAALFFAQAHDVGSGGESRLGYEVIVPRAITPEEIHRVRRPPQVVGWRHAPQAHTKALVCPCLFCIPSGSIRGRRKRTRIQAAVDKATAEIDARGRAEEAASEASDDRDA